MTVLVTISCFCSHIEEASFAGWSGASAAAALQGSCVPLHVINSPRSALGGPEPGKLDKLTCHHRTQSTIHSQWFSNLCPLSSQQSELCKHHRIGDAHSHLPAWRELSLILSLFCDFAFEPARALQTPSHRQNPVSCGCVAAYGQS